MSEMEVQFTITTISTIAIKSGKTRIVIALLQSGNRLDLKILEMAPNLIQLGDTFDEASELEIAHNYILQQLQNKQSPVEELLKKADQTIADQKSQAQVYITMADSLGQAWKDIHSLLLTRKHVLHLNVTYHSKMEACVERMRVLELLCLSPMPHNESMLKENLEFMQEIKKSMLECLLGALKAGQNLLSVLNNLATEGSVDSRTTLTKRTALFAIAQVEKWMEDLHNRRRILAVTWQRRKLNLEKCRTVLILKCDLDLLESLLKERYKWLSHQRNQLGSTSSEAEDLLTQHMKLFSEAKNFQEESLRMVKASEKLPSSIHKFSQNSNKISYNVLNLANDYVQAMHEREELLKRSIRFCNNSKSVILKLEELRHQLTNVNSTSERLIIMDMTEEITKDIIKEGYLILECVPDARGVASMLNKIENEKKDILSYCCKENEEKYEVSLILNAFYEKHNEIFSWIVSAVEFDIQKHQNMGNSLKSAENFLRVHEKLSNELQLRRAEITELGVIIPRHTIDQLQANTKEDISRKIQQLETSYHSCKRNVDDRIGLASKYFELHSLAHALETELDSFANSLSETDAMKVCNTVEPISVKINHLHKRLRATAEDFLDVVNQTRDSYLDASTARLCVETVLEHFANRKSDIEEKWNIWERSALDKETSQHLWIRKMVDNEDTIDWVLKLEAQLYPVLNTETTDADAQVQQIEYKLKHIIPEIKRAQEEIQLRIETAEELIVEGGLDNNEQVPPKLQELHDSICTIVIEYNSFLEIFASFLTNIRELEEKIVDLKEVNDRSNDLSSAEVSDLRVKLLASYRAFNDLWNSSHSESQKVITKIKQQESSKYAEKDIQAVNNLIENKKLEWESVSASLEQKLKRYEAAKEFDQDLHDINSSIEELSNELTTLQQQYCRSVSSAKSSSLALEHLEQPIQVLETKIETFLNTVEDVTSEADEDEVEAQLNDLKDRWNKFCADVAETKQFVNLSIRYFTLIEETEEYFRDGTKLLVCVAKKSSSARSASEAELLLNNIQHFLNSAHCKQEERFRDICTLVEEIFDDDEHIKQVSRINSENEELLESFSTVNKELESLHEKLLREASSASEMAEEQIPSSEIVDLERSPPTSKVEQVSEEKTESSVEVLAESSTADLPTENDKLDEALNVQPPKFVTQMEDATIAEGSEFVFECHVESQTIPQITWLKENVVVEKNPNYQISFADGICQMRIKEVFAKDSARFTCRAVNEGGTCEISAKLSILEAQGEREMCAPTFVTPLTDVTAKLNEPCELSCEVDGCPLPVIQWYRGEECVDCDPQYEATYNNANARLLIKCVTLDDVFTFTCTASNSCGKVSSSCDVKLSIDSTSVELPAFSTCLSNLMVRVGQKVKLECSVTGIPFPILTWYHNSEVVKEQSNIIMSVDDKGKVALIIVEAFPKDAGTYTVVASNQAGETSCSCNVSVKGSVPCESSDSEILSDVEPIKPSISSPLTHQVVHEGSEAILACVITGQPEPEVTWYHDKVPVKEGDKIELYFKGDKCSLHVKQSCCEDAGVYKVVAINSAGEISSTCQLDVIEVQTDTSEYDENTLTAPKFEKLLSDILIREGETAVLQCSPTGRPQPEVKWFLNSSEIHFNDRVTNDISDDGVISLTIRNITSDDKGLYSVRATNSLGEAKCFSHLIVKSLSSANATSSDVHLEDRFERPVFAEVIMDKTVTNGAPVKFETIVNGKPAPKVRWLFNDEPVSGKSFLVSTSGDRQVLYIPQVSQENDGIICCIAENDVGKTSCVAQLRVLDSGVHEERLLPAVDTMTNAFESSKTYEIKKETLTKSVAFNNEPAVSKIDTYLSVSEHGSKKVNDGEPIQMESHRREEKYETDGSGTSLSNQLYSFGSLETSQGNELVKQNSLTALKPARKQTAPRFLSTLSGAIVDAGREFIFEAIIESYPTAEIKWYKNNELLSSDDEKIRISYELNRATLQILNVDETDAGRYTCMAENNIGISSSSADLFVKKTAFPPVIGRRLQPRSVVVGTRVIFEIEVTGTPSPNVTWFKDDIQLPRTSPFYRLTEQGNSHALIIEKVRSEDSGQYKVKAHNEAGEAVSLATLNTFEPPKAISEDYLYSSNIEGVNPSVFPVSRDSLIESELNSTKSVEITKQNKNISFIDGHKVRDDKNSFTEKYSYGNDNKCGSALFDDYSFSPSQSCCYAPPQSTTAHTNASEMEMLQKPLVYSNMENFQSYCAYDKTYSTGHNEIFLEPGPPPEIGYIPKDAVPKAREPMAERVKKLESTQRQLSPVEIPTGAVKIFPTIVPKARSSSESENAVQKKYSSCIKEYKNSVRRSSSCDRGTEECFMTEPSRIHETPNIKVSNLEKMKKKEETETLFPIYRPQAEVHLRPLSPRPSAEGISMERLWSHKKSSEEHNSYLPPPPPLSAEDNSYSAFARMDTRRCASPSSSAQTGVTDNVWSQARDKRNRPHTVIGIHDLLPSNLRHNISESFRSEIVENRSQNIGGQKSETKHVNFQDLATVNDKVVRQNVFEDTYSTTSNMKDDAKVGAAGVRFLEGKTGKKAKFKWPPQEVAIEDSLVRRNVNNLQQKAESFGSCHSAFRSAPLTETAAENSQRIPEQEMQKYVYGGVRTVPYPSQKSLKEKQEVSYNSNHTLPRSFKFSSSDNSKFKPVAKSFGTDYTNSLAGSQTIQSHFQNEWEPKNVGGIANTSWQPVSESGIRKHEAGTSSTDGKFISDVSSFSQSTSSGFRKYGDDTKMQTLPRISDKNSSSFYDDTKISSSCDRTPTYSTFTPVTRHSQFMKCDRESEYESASDYENRIPPIWRPSDGDLNARRHYRPVRPNLAPVQRPFYSRSTSNETSSGCKYNTISDVSRSNKFTPVSPVAEFSSVAKVKPSPAFSDTQREFRNSYSSQAGDSDFRRRELGESFHTESWQKPANYESRYEESRRTSVSDSIISNKMQKVEEIRKRFESSFFSNESSAMSSFEDKTLVSNGVKSSRIPADTFSATSRPNSDIFRPGFKSQQFIDKIVNNVNNKQTELKLCGQKSPSSLFNSPILSEPRIFKDHFKNTTEHSSFNESGWISDMNRSSEADYCIVNEDSVANNEGSHTLPIFSTPLHDIAAVIGSKAKFECIVQSDSPYTIEWRKDGCALQNSELCQISLRNGVCKLELLKCYMFDGGIYQCIAANRAGFVETSATLTVSGERRSYIKK